MDDKDNWVTIPGYGNYEINEVGDVRRIKDAFLMKDLLRNDYRSINLISDYGVKTFLSIHVLVCTIFNGNKPETPEGCKLVTCNHKDGNKMNCCKSNLEWSTNSDNIIHAYKNRLNKSSQHVILENQVTGEIIKLHSLRELSRWLGNKDISGRSFIVKYKDILYDGVWKVSLNGEMANDSGSRTCKRFYGIELANPKEMLSFKSGHEAAGILDISRRSIGRSIKSKGVKVVSGWVFSEDKLDLIKLINK